MGDKAITERILVCDPYITMPYLVRRVTPTEWGRALPPSGLIEPMSGTILCPLCGDEYSQIGRVFTLLGSDALEAGVYDGTEAVGCTPSRRSALGIEFEGECGHSWSLIIQQHKGNNFVYVDLPNLQTSETVSEEQKG